MTMLDKAKDELKADPKLAIKPTPAAIVAARDKAKLRWERVAAFAGISVKEAKDLYEKGSGNPWQQSFTGRGRNWTAIPRKDDKPAPAPAKRVTRRKPKTDQS
jgi:hypothetical protein